MEFISRVTFADDVSCQPSAGRDSDFDYAESSSEASSGHNLSGFASLFAISIHPGANQAKQHIAYIAIQWCNMCSYTLQVTEIDAHL